MNRWNRTRVAAVAATALLLSACSVDATHSPAYVASSQAVQSAPAFEAGVRNISGDYAGTFNDANSGNGHAHASFSEHRGAVGGSILETLVKQKQRVAVAGILNSKDALAATMAGNVGSSACTFALSAKYDASTHRLNGTYQAIHGCTGDTGSFSLKQQCYFVLRAGAIRRDVGGLMPC